MTNVPSALNFKCVKAVVERAVAMYITRTHATKEKLKTKNALQNIFNEEPYLTQLPHRKGR